MTHLGASINLGRCEVKGGGEREGSVKVLEEVYTVSTTVAE